MTRGLENITWGEAEKAKFMESSERDGSGWTWPQSNITVTTEIKEVIQSQKIVGQGAMAC